MASSRVVVVVPRQEAQLHEYLLRSLACLQDVEVVLDRRAIAAGRRDERRRQPSESVERKILLCSIVHCPSPPVPVLDEPPALDQPPTLPERSAATPCTHHRTLLWPGLRLEHL